MTEQYEGKSRGGKRRSEKFGLVAVLEISKDERHDEFPSNDFLRRKFVISPHCSLLLRISACALGGDESGSVALQRYFELARPLCH